jgi:hypothetical protein
VISLSASPPLRFAPSAAPCGEQRCEGRLFVEVAGLTAFIISTGGRQSDCPPNWSKAVAEGLRAF